MVDRIEGSGPTGEPPEVKPPEQEGFFSIFREKLTALLGGSGSSSPIDKELSGSAKDTSDKISQKATPLISTGKEILSDTKFDMSKLNAFIKKSAKELSPKDHERVLVQCFVSVCNNENIPKEALEKLIPKSKEGKEELSRALNALNQTGIAELTEKAADLLEENGI